MLNEFIQSLNSTGIHKPSNYSMQIIFPDRVATKVRQELSITLKDETDMFMRIERVNIPADNIALEEQYSQSRRMRHIAADRESPEHLAFSVILSENMRERQIFEVWNEFIYGKDDQSYQPKFLDTYVGPSATIRILNEKSEMGVLGALKSGLLDRFGSNSMVEMPELKYVYKNVFPVTLGEIELSYSDTDTYSTMTVTMAYSSWDRVLS